MGGTCLLFFIMTENVGDVKIKGFSQGNFAAPAAGRVPPCGAGSFSTWKRNKKTLGDAAEANFVRHVGLPPDPRFTGAAN